MRHFLTVGDVMTKDVVTVAEDTSFKAVAAVLAEHHISAVPVRSSYGGIVGVVSETDLLRKEEFQRARRSGWFLRRKAHAKAEALTAGQLMTSPAVTVEAGCTLDEAARLMAARDLTRLVVTGAGDEMVGIVARSDLLSAYLDSDEETLARIRRDVIDRHLWDDPRAVEVSVVDGVVTLTGQVEKRSTTEFAEHLIAGVDGVVAVHNNLTWGIDDITRTSGGIFY